MKKDEKKEKTVTLLIVCKDGKRIIEIPDTWKITYGRLHGGDSRAGGFGDGNVLRIYESKEKQRAIFTNVVSFIDLSIKVKKLVAKKEEEITIKTKSGGKKRERQHEERQDIQEEWVDEYSDAKVPF